MSLATCDSSDDGAPLASLGCNGRAPSHRWTVASNSATRASRVRMYSLTATGVCSHRSGGKDSMVFMGLDHTRPDTGWQVLRCVTT